MVFLTFFSPIVLIITTIVMTLSLILANKTKNDREKGSPFECGFDSNSNFRIPFSLRFFLITIIFLIFDVEIVMLLPSVKSVMMSSIINWTMVYFSFMIILLLGLFHEWNQGALNWTL